MHDAERGPSTTHTHPGHAETPPVSVEARLAHLTDPATLS